MRLFLNHYHSTKSANFGITHLGIYIALHIPQLTISHEQYKKGPITEVHFRLKMFALAT